MDKINDKLTDKERERFIRDKIDFINTMERLIERLKKEDSLYTCPGVNERL